MVFLELLAVKARDEAVLCDGGLERIIVDLKDKVIKLDLGGDPTEIPMLEVEADNGIKTEAISALTMLGFAAAASGKAVDKILKAEPTLTVEGVIRKALTML